jgi:hypothetical protein
VTNCPALYEGRCSIASTIASMPISPTPRECELCKQCQPPQSVNDVTRMLAHRTNPDLYNHERGTGTRLARLLSWFVTRPTSCNCGDREQIMNMWGPDGCKENKRTILGWLRESALDNGYPYNEMVISIALNVVIENSREDYAIER